VVSYTLIIIVNIVLMLFLALFLFTYLFIVSFLIYVTLFLLCFFSNLPNGVLPLFDAGPLFKIVSANIMPSPNIISVVLPVLFSFF
jgi:hypothetical protein